MLRYFIYVSSDSKKTIFFKMLKTLILLFLLLIGYFLFIINFEKSTLDKIYMQYLKHQIAYKIEPYDENSLMGNPIILMYYFHKDEIIVEHRNVGEIIFNNYSEDYSGHNAIDNKPYYKILENYYKNINKNNLELNGDFFDAKNIINELNNDSQNKYYKFLFDIEKNKFLKEIFNRNAFTINIDKYTNRAFKMLDYSLLITDFIIYYLILIILPMIYYILRMFYNINLTKK